MAKFEAKETRVYQLPTGNVSMGFMICECDLDDGTNGGEHNAKVIARCLNQNDAIKDLATWLLKQKTLHLNKERRALLEGIVNG